MPDLGQVAELDAGVVAVGLVAVVAVAGGDGVDVEDPGPLTGYPGGEPPGAVSARWSGSGRGEGEPGAGGAGWPSFALGGVAAGFGEIGRASCRERGEIGVGSGSFRHSKGYERR